MRMQAARMARGARTARFTTVGGMTDEKTKTREAPISYRPPAALREEFRTRAQRSGLSVSAFITAAIFNTDPPRQSRRPSADARAVAEILAGLAAIRDRLDEIARTDPDGTDRIGEALRQLTEIRAAAFKALGRKP